MMIPNDVPKLKRLTIIGLGNEMLSDDGLGIRVVREVKHRLNDCSVSFEELSVGGIQLFDYLIGTEECIIVDAIMTGTQPAGTLMRFVQSADGQPVSLTSSHQIDLGHILGLARFMGAPLPKRLTVYGVEVDDITTFGEECTAQVSQAIPKLVDVICDDVQKDHDVRTRCSGEWQIINELVTD